ncbi:MAG: site-specific integrase [Syntrophomonas sp.]
MGLNAKVLYLGNGEYRLTAYLGKDEDGVYRRRTKLIEGDPPTPKGQYPKKVKDQLADFANEVENELNQASIVQDTLLLGDYLQQWLAFKKPEVEAVTYDSYKSNVEAHITPILGHIPINDLTPLHFQEFYAGKKEHGRLPKKKKPKEGVIKNDAETKPEEAETELKTNKSLSNRSVQLLHSILHQALDRAVDLELMTKNPTEKIKPKRDKRKQKEHVKINVLDAHQLVAFLEGCIEHRDYAIIYCAAYTGARQSELIALTWNKILWDKKIIQIEESINLLDSGEFDPGSTKNEPSTRDIQVTERVIATLKAHRKALNKYMAATGTRNPKGLVFPDLLLPEPSEGKSDKRKGFYLRRKTAKTDSEIQTTTEVINLSYMNRKNLSNRFSTLAERFGHPEFTFHGLRHSHATILLSRGWYIVDVSERLGHADVDTTLRTYAHFIPKRKAEVAKKFDEIMDGND